jgi:8-amino-7-oxononanoate synthase
MTRGRRNAKPGGDLFDKCREFTRPQELRDAGLYIWFEVFEGHEGCAPGEIRLRGRKVLMFGSNDYLGLTTHPRVKAAAQEAVRRYGSGCSGSRLLNGTLDLHIQVEDKLAKLVHKEAAMIYGTGFQGNYAALSAITERGDVLLCDHTMHASLLEGAVRSPARTVRFRHNDMAHLEHCLQTCAPEEKVLVVTEGVFSMEGDLADLPALVKLSRDYQARVYVDEAHGIGVLGATGAGAAEHFGVLDDIDILMGTFSKSLASVGGFVAAEKTVIDYLKHNARPYVFSAALAPASVGAVNAALDIMREEPERRQRLIAVARRLREALRSRGCYVLDGETPIVPVVVESETDLCRLCKGLIEEGIYVNPVLRPAATENLLRISCTAVHTDAHVDRLVDSICRVSKRLDIDLCAQE